MDTPYYIYPALTAYAEAEGDEKTRLRRLLGATVGNREALRVALGIDPEEFMEFYPDMRKPELTTDDAIERFAATYGPGTAPAADYASTLMEETADQEAPPFPADDTTAAIDAFLGAMGGGSATVETAALPDDVLSDDASEEALAEETEAEEEAGEPAVEVEPESTTLSESLAAMMIRSGNHAKALEILTALAEKTPDPPYYLADQIRFLRRIVAIQR